MTKKLVNPNGFFGITEAFVGLVLVVGIVVAIIVFLQGTQNTFPPSLTLTRTVSDSKLEWSTYSSVTYGFSVQYPNDWSIVQRQAKWVQIVAPNGWKVEISVINKTEGQTFEDWLKERDQNQTYGGTVLSKTQVIIDGLSGVTEKAEIIAGRPDEKVWTVVTFLDDGDKVYVIFGTDNGITSPEEFSDEIFDRISHSFVLTGE